MRSSLACRLFSCSVLGAVLLVAGCGTDQETGLLALSISADPTNPPMPASKIVLTGPGFTRTYTGPFPPGGDAGATLVLEYPNLPTSSSPVALTVQAYDSNGCQVGAASVPVSVTIQAGVKNGPFPVTLAAVAACGDGGILRVSQDSGAGAAEAGGLDARADGPPTGDAAADKPADASVPSSGAEVSDGGGDTGTGGTTESGDAWVPDAPDGQPDVPIDGSGGSIGTAGTTAVGGTSGSGGTTNTGGTGAVGGTTGSGGVGTGGAVGTGGTTAVCQGSATRCSSNSVQTCTNAQWGSAVACGTRQTCTGPVGTAKCTCNVDPVCTSVGNTCASASTLANCSQDAQACFYESSATTCTNGACTGAAGAASCCTNACTVGATCLSSTSLQTCAVAANGCTAYGAATTCANGACTGAAGTASCCTNACTAGTTCVSSTSLQTCAVGSNGCTASSTAACSTGLVCERYGTASCADPNWDEWPIPNSQVDVTAGAPSLESYTDNGDGTVTDNVTGLMWQQAVPSATYTWANAVAYCPTLNLAGHNDWRLPSQIELESIIDFGQLSPSINSTYFPSTPTDTYFWSSSLAAGLPSSAGIVYFLNGATNIFGMAGSEYVRCVR